MPIYQYECTYCQYNFEKIHKIIDRSGKEYCPRCGNTAFKIPSVFVPRVFRPRKFSDNTETPDNVRTHSQEKVWMKKNKITYEPSTRKKGDSIRENRKKKFVKGGFFGNQMEHAFKKAFEKVNDGFKIEKPKHRKTKRRII